MNNCMGKNEKKSALVIINPYAGRMRSRTGVFDIINHLSQNEYDITVHATTKKMML